MDIDTLRTFLLLAENKSFTKTAEIQHIVQPTVSARIRDLEDELGKPLFTRNNRRVELTTAGTLYIDYARRMISLYEESKNKLDSSMHFKKHITIGGLDIIWRCALSELTKQFLNETPDISIHVITYSTNFVTQLLIDRTIDVAFICSPIRLPSIMCIPAFYDDVILVANPSHPISNRPFIDVEELNTIPIVYGNLGGTFNEWFERNMRTSNNLRVQFDITSLTIPFILDGYGPALILRSMVDSALKDGTLVEIPLIGKEPLPRWISYMAFEKAKKDNPEIVKLITLMKVMEKSQFHRNLLRR